MKWFLQNKKLGHTLELDITEKSSEFDVEASDHALALIGLNVSAQFKSMIGDCSSAKEAWLRLKGVFQSQNNANRLLLKQELAGLQQQHSESLIDYVTRAKSIHLQLVGTGYKADKADLTYNILMGLTEQYRSMVDTFIANSEPLDIDVLLPKLMTIEARYNRGPGVTLRDNATKVLYAGQHGSAPSRIQCWKCKQYGHKKSACPQLKGQKHAFAGLARVDAQQTFVL